MEVQVHPSHGKRLFVCTKLARESLNFYEPNADLFSRTERRANRLRRRKTGGGAVEKLAVLARQAAHSETKSHRYRYEASLAE